MRIKDVSWVTEAQREVLAKHRILTLDELASFELVDSMAKTIPLDGLRALARRARASLGRPDPMAMIGAASGQRGPVRYAGGVRYDDGKG